MFKSLVQNNFFIILVALRSLLYWCMLVRYKINMTSTDYPIKYNGHSKYIVHHSLVMRMFMYSVFGVTIVTKGIDGHTLIFIVCRCGTADVASHVTTGF